MLLLFLAPATLTVSVKFKPHSQRLETGFIFYNFRRDGQWLRKILYLSALPADEIDMTGHVDVIAVVPVIKFKFLYQSLLF